MDTRVYELEFPDGRVDDYPVNNITENLLKQADADGWDTGALKEIISFGNDPNVSVPKEKGIVTTLNGNKTRVITTKG